MNVVPFTLSNVCAGFAEGDGILRDEGDILCLEYQVKDGILGVLKSAVTQVRIPMEELVSVTLTKGWFGTNWGVKILIQVLRMETVQDIQTANQGRVELSIARKDYDAAEEFVRGLRAEESQPAGAQRT